MEEATITPESIAPGVRSCFAAPSLPCQGESRKDAGPGEMTLVAMKSRVQNAAVHTGAINAEDILIMPAIDLRMLDAASAMPDFRASTN